MSAVSNIAHRKPHPWWMELALVDFRHAFWPWVVYMTAVMSLWLLPLGPLGAPLDIDAWPWIAATVGLVGPAIVARVFCSDSASSTMATLLTSPRSRSSVWFVRTGSLALMLFLPVLLCAVPLPHPWTSWTHTDQFLMAAAVVTLTALAWCYATVGVLLAILLKRPLLVWTAILISPLIVLLLFVLVDAIIGLDLALKPGDQLKSPVNAEFWFVLVFGAIAYIIAWRLWLRLEVRS